MKRIYITLLGILPLFAHGQKLPANPITIGAGMQALRIDGAKVTAFHKTVRLGFSFARSRVLLTTELGYAQAQRRNAKIFEEYSTPDPSTWSRYTADLTGFVNILPSGSKHLLRVGAGIGAWAISDDVSTRVYELPGVPDKTGFGYTRNRFSAIRTGGNVSAEYGYKLQKNFHLELRLRAVNLKGGGINPGAGVGISYLL